MNILSVDWDYFYPDNFMFDWQMNEDNPIYYETIWPIRYGSHNLKTNEMAKDYYMLNETYNRFWEKVLQNSDPIKLVISDSHTDMSFIFKLFKGKVNIWNFDQHNDLGYGSQNNRRLDCGNWVKYFWKRIKEYHLIYPEWRKHNPEGNGFEGEYSVYYEIPDWLPDFDIVFICRSSPWTPSWYDDKWIKFIEYFKRFNTLWERKAAAPYVLKSRPFDKQGAEDLIEQIKQQIELQKERSKTNE
jgi:hypothetical protein